MINLEGLEKEIKKNNIKNSYIFCGLDEELIKEGVNDLIKPYLKDPFIDLNFLKFDGSSTSFDEIFNSCETLPLMSDKKIVLVSRGNFLREKSDSQGSKFYEELKTYIKDIPSHVLLIIYYVFSDKRETLNKNKKLLYLDKHSTVVHVEKLKRDRYYKKIEEMFIEAGGKIGKVELRYFSERVVNNFEVIKREIDKLVSYGEGREIKKDDIEKLVAPRSEDDIFDLVDFISQGKIEKAIDVLDDLLFKADQHMLIVTAIEAQFKKLYKLKVLSSQGKKKDDIVKEMKLPLFVVEKLMNLSNKFSKRQLEGFLKLSLETENKLKSSGVDKKVELELLLINTLRVRK